MSDISFYGGSGFGGINKPNVIKTVIVPVASSSTTTVHKTAPTDPPVYKEAKKRRKTKPRKKSKAKPKKKRKAPKKRKQQIASKQVHFGKNF